MAVVAVTAQREERARRLASRDGLTVEEAAGAIRAREASEHTRYLQFYGIDPEREPVDLLVDSTSLAAEAVAAQIVAFLRQRWGEADA